MSVAICHWLTSQPQIHHFAKIEEISVKMRSKNVLKFPLKEKPRKTIISKIRAFFASSEGRSTSQWMVGTAAIGTLCVVYLPQTIFFDEYLEYILDRSK